MIITWAILVGIVVLVALYARLNVLEARRIRLLNERRAIQKHDLAHLFIEGDPGRVRSLGVEVGR